MALNCTVDGTQCASANFVTNANPALAGWVNLLIDGSGNDSEDHSFSFTWCTPITKGKGKNALNHEVILRMADVNGSNAVDIEHVIVTIDGSKIAASAQACTGFTPP